MEVGRDIKVLFTQESEHVMTENKLTRRISLKSATAAAAGLALPTIIPAFKWIFDNGRIRAGAIGAAMLAAAMFLPMRGGCGESRARTAAEKGRMDFSAPPREARPWVLYFIGDANYPVVTREGLTRDLEAMKQQGLGGVVFFYGWRFLDPQGNASWQNQPEWWNLMRHGLQEARRVGLPVLLFNSPVWNSGGPWVKPEDAMKEYTWSRLEVEGGRNLSVTLPPLPCREGFARDALVIAYPTPGHGRVSRMQTAQPKITASANEAGKIVNPGRFPSDLYDPADPLRALNDGNFLTGVTLPAKGPVQFVEYTFSQPFACDSIFVQLDRVAGPVDFELQTAGEGEPFKTHHRFAMEKPGRVATSETYEPKRESFTPVQARRYRLLIKPREKGEVHVAEAELLGRDEVASAESFILNLRAKTGSRPPFLPDAFREQTGKAPVPWCVPGDKIVDLTGCLGEGGKLTWGAPAGKWTILRFGYTLTGIRSVPDWAVSSIGDGFEVDRFDRAALERHFNAFTQKILDDPAVKGSIIGIEEDSWEVHWQTWSKSFAKDFRSRRGHELLPWLPVLAGEVVDSAEASERFLWEYRRTIADVITDNFYGTYAELCHRNGVKFHSEASGPGIEGYPPSDVLMYKGRADVPMGEFHSWKEKKYDQPDVKEAASAAHLYGKPIAATESFTGIDDFRKDPYWLKALSDRAFCAGINHFYLHVYTLKPDERKPGPIMSTLWGVGFNRHQTWWPMAKGYFDYLARCQQMLRRGRFAADLLYFYGEGAPGFAWNEEGQDGAGGGNPRTLQPALPKGYDYDWCNTEILLTRLSVKGGKLVTPDGIAYRMLILPERAEMTPKLLRKLEEFVKAGATILGPKPMRSPALKDAKEADAEVREIANRLWGESQAASASPLVHPYGKGRVISGMPMEKMPITSLLAQDGVTPDFEWTGGSKDLELLFIHRVDKGDDIYFVGSQSDQTEAVQCTFRVKDKQPQLMDPVTGEIRDLPEYSATADGRLRVPFKFAPRQSFFVNFRKMPESEGAKPAIAANFPQAQTLQEIIGPWEVRFDPKWGGPEKAVFERLEDWTKRPEEGIQYYSGIAVYRKEFDLARPLSSGRLYLDLGIVKNLARVRLNGRELGVAWTAPWQVDATGALKEKGNVLEIEVANVWINRLQRDRQLREKERLTWTNANETALGGRDLLPAGLLGPVTLRIEERASREKVNPEEQVKSGK